MNTQHWVNGRRLALMLMTGAAAAWPTNATLAAREDGQPVGLPVLHHAESAPLWHRLAHFDDAMRENATLDVELSGDATAEERIAAQEIAARWNNGGYDDAINALRALEAGGTRVAVGTSWKEPIPLGPTGWDADVWIGSPQIWADETCLGSYGTKLFAAIRWNAGDAMGWSLHISTDHGVTWLETYHKYTDPAPTTLDMAVAFNYVYIAYVWGAEEEWGRLSRLFCSNGQIDYTYGNNGIWFVLHAWPDDIREVDVELGTSLLNDRFVHYYAIQTNNVIRHFHQEHLSGDPFQESATGVSNAWEGLDASIDPNSRWAYPFVSYIGVDSGVYVWRSSDVISLGTFTGTNRVTSISSHVLYQTTYAILAAEGHTDFGQGIRYWVSRDNGDTWAPSWLAYPVSGEGDYTMPAVNASAYGFAAVYQQETGSFDTLFYRQRPGLSVSSPWWEDQVAANDYSLETGSCTAISDVPVIAGQEMHAHGAIYLRRPYDYPPYKIPYFTRAPGPGGYCQAGGQEYTVGYISNVTVGTINNSSGPSAYSEYTEYSTEMTQGQGCEAVVTAVDAGPDFGCGIWVDWNQDLDFDDASEAMDVDGSPGEGPYSAMIIPPFDAELGETRLRVRVSDGYPAPCFISDYGEVEDYTVIVIEGQECPADFDGDGDVDTADLLHLLGAWGTPDGDVDGDGDTDTADLLALLAAWGECP